MALAGVWKVGIGRQTGGCPWPQAKTALAAVYSYHVDLTVTFLRLIPHNTTIATVHMNPRTSGSNDGATENARPDIARPDNAAPYRKGGHRETCFIVRVDANYTFMFDSVSIIWAAHRFYICYVRQKLASSLDNVWAHYKIVIVWSCKQRCSSVLERVGQATVVQRFNSVLLHEGFVDDDRPE